MQNDVQTPLHRARRLPFWARICGWIALFSGIIMLGLCIALFVSVARVAAQMPSFDSMKAMPTGRTIRIHAANGAVLQTNGPAYGQWVTYERIPDTMRNAVIAIEDRRFEHHFGVDPKSVLRAAWLAWRNHGEDRRMQGASTITQQAARTIFLNNSYDFRRKLREMVIALAMEQRLTKHQILELYLNRVYLGGGAYGFDAASRRFFGHPGTRLTVQEAALLAGLAKAPSNYAPSADPQKAFARTKVVLSAMVDSGALPSKAPSALPMPRLAPDQPAVQTGVGYFLDWVRPQIDATIGDAMGAIDVWTTLDPDLQEKAEKAVIERVPNGAQGALTSVDGSGRIRAMVGGLDYAASRFNRATQASRQPGSSFKLFVYLAALETGRTPDELVQDQPIDINGWSPRNSEGAAYGSLSLTEAFAKSVNTIAVQVANSAGFDNVARAAKRLGVSTPINTDPAMALGASEVHLVDMVRAYATIGGGGVAVVPYGIERITSGNREIYRHVAEPQQIVAPGVARDLTTMLQAVVSQGTGRAAAIGRTVAGKTGTTNSSKDGWFIGFSSGITTGVWIGRDDSRPIAGLQGGRAPAAIFAAYMTQATKGLPIPTGELKASIPGWGVPADSKADDEAPAERIDGAEPAAPGAAAVVVNHGSDGEYIEETYGHSKAVPMQDPTD